MQLLDGLQVGELTKEKDRLRDIVITNAQEELEWGGLVD